MAPLERLTQQQQQCFNIFLVIVEQRSQYWIKNEELKIHSYIIFIAFQTVFYLIVHLHLEINPVHKNTNAN